MKYYSVKEQLVALREAEKLNQSGLEERARLHTAFSNEKRIISKEEYKRRHAPKK